MTKQSLSTLFFHLNTTHESIAYLNTASTLAYIASLTCEKQLFTSSGLAFEGQCRY